MKKQLILATVAAMVAFTSCEKKTAQSPVSPSTVTNNGNSNLSARLVPNVSVINGIVWFSDYDSYEGLVNDGSDANYQDWLNQSSALGFSSLLNNKSSNKPLFDAIPSDFFKSILNVKGEAIIGSYLFQISPPDSLGYILFDPSHSFKTSDIAALESHDLTNPNIIAVELNRDGLGILADFDADLAKTPTTVFNTWWANYKTVNPNVILKTTQIARCKEDGCGERRDSKTFGVGGMYNVTAFYDRSLFFFSLHGDFYNCGTYGQVKFDVPICCYHKKCSGNGGGAQTCNTGTFMGTYAKYQSYQGSTPLNGFHFKIRGTNTTCSGSTWSPYAEIYANPPC